MRQTDKLLKLLTALIEYDSFYRQKHQSLPDYAETPCTRKDLMLNTKGALKCARLTAYDAIDTLVFEGFIRLSANTPTANRDSLYLLNVPLIKAEHAKIIKQQNAQKTLDTHTLNSYANPIDAKVPVTCSSETETSMKGQRSKVSQEAITATS